MGSAEGGGHATAPEPSVVLVLDREGKVRFASTSRIGWYEGDGNQFVGSRFWELVARGADKRARGAVTQAVSQGAVTELDAPLATSRGWGPALWWQITPVADAEGNCREVVAVGQDPTALAPLGHELVEAFFAHTLTATALTDPALRLIRVNEAYARIFGREVDDFPGRDLAEFYPGNAQAAAHSVAIDKRPHLETETRFVLRDHPEGGVTYWDCEVVPVLDHAKDVVVVLISVRDVTERKRAATVLEKSRGRLHALAAELSIAEAQTRRRIARELHDNLGHTLSYAIMKVEELRSQVPPQVAPALDDLGTFLDRAVDATSSMTFELSPPILHDLGLGPALEWLAEQVLRDHHLRVEVDAPDDPPRLPESTAVTLFQTARELLANVIKHARATRASVSVRYPPGAVSLEVQDDGVGFDPAQLEEGERPGSSFGLLSITQRISYLGGSVDIVSRHGQGTRVLCIAPLGTPQIGAEVHEGHTGG